MELALTVYTGMADIASKHAAYQEYLDVIQFRMAEILLAQGETEEGGPHLWSDPDKNAGRSRCTLQSRPDL